MAEIKPVLIFHVELSNDNDPYGRLELWEHGNYPDLRCQGRYIALSGLPGFQSFNDQHSKGRGPIPRPDVAGIGCYQVATSPHFVPASEQPGIAGNFYEIFPSFVENNRGLFGIHLDANVVGTAGCVGVKNVDAWKDFQVKMEALLSAGVTRVPLIVGYS
jgi:hypothetical protein